MDIVCVHQGVELYGSDRMFLQAVEGMRRRWPEARIKVVLPGTGPLNDRLAAVADKIEVRGLCILRLAEPVKTLLKSTIGLPYYVGRALADVWRADLLYVNTVVVADHILAARFLRSRSVIHVHEIPRGRALPPFRALCRLSGAALIFNSRATADAFGPEAMARQEVIHNGVGAVADAAAPDVPARFGGERPLRLALPGRINSWKGQDLLVEAIGSLAPEDHARFDVRIVGGSFGGAAGPVDRLREVIDRHGLGDVVRLEPFRDDPAAVYRWADLCVVPSRQPEPFGLVAIEAMASGRAVIAAAHGGLMEIVDPSSGWLFPPNDAAALATALKEALDHPERVSARGLGALDRFTAHFSAGRMQRHLTDTLARWMG